MIRLKQYIAEAKESSEDQLTHLEHLEDHAVHGGHKGFAHAYHTLNGVHERLLGKEGNTKVTIKYDGSPSVVFGTHPETGKFFVGSKSAFAKTPKINYTPEDIEKNHGHAPGLVKKLKAALEHLPKIHDKKGVYQADIMHTPDEVKHEGHRITHKTQLITYHHKPNSQEGMKASNSQLGVAIHTAYEGNKWPMTVKQGHVPELKDHKDVHQLPIHHELHHVPYTKALQDEYKTHLSKAMDVYKKAPKEAFDHAADHSVHLKTYINQAVRKNEAPSHEGFVDHLSRHYTKKAAGVKTPAAKDKHIAAGQAHMSKINKEHITHVLDAHKHLQNAKNVLTKSLNSHQIHGHEIDGAPANPEGYVVIHNERPSKFVLRHEFSAMNLRAGDERKKGGK